MERSVHGCTALSFQGMKYLHEEEYIAKYCIRYNDIMETVT